MSLPLDLGVCVVRDFVLEDAPALVRYANNRKVWRNLRDLFPHPYTQADADGFIARAIGCDPRDRLAVALGAEAIGGIGYTLHADVERASAELGYWIGEPFWGRGIATAAVRAVTRLIFARHPVEHVYAMPFSWNPGSARVLEKAGFQLEGQLRRHVIKDGHVLDQLVYGIVREESES